MNGPYAATGYRYVVTLMEGTGWRGLSDDLAEDGTWEPDELTPFGAVKHLDGEHQYRLVPWHRIASVHHMKGKVPR